MDILEKAHYGTSGMTLDEIAAESIGNKLTPAERNIADIDRIRKAMCRGEISYDEAKTQAAPVIERINASAKQIAKKYNKRPQLVNFAALMR